MSWLILKNTDGKPDAVFTMAVWAVTIVLFKVLFAGMSITVGERVLTAGIIDAGVIAAVLTPTLGAYVVRRHTDANAPHAHDASKIIGGS